MKSVLLVTSVPSMIGQFNMDNIHILRELGYKVEVACDFLDCSIWTKESTGLLIEKLDEIDVKRYQIDFSRSPLDISKHYKSYMQIKDLLAKGEYTFIHTHAPVSSAITRLACKNINTKVIYTAHGFHFYSGAPIINWFIYYPIEKWLSKYTDVLITINKEDYERARKKFNAKKVQYICGIGVELENFKRNINRNDIRKKLGFSENDFIILSVGELNKNKNHEVIMRAIATIEKDVHYLIAGKGILKDKLIKLSNTLKIEDNVHLLGYCNTVNDLYHCADLFVHPSFREGLPVALIEAMSSGIPCIASDVRGNNDLINYDSNLTVSPKDVDKWKISIERFLHNELDMDKIKNMQNKSLDNCDKRIVEVAYRKVYEEI